VYTTRDPTGSSSPVLTELSVAVEHTAAVVVQCRDWQRSSRVSAGGWEVDMQVLGTLDKGCRTWRTKPRDFAPRTVAFGNRTAPSVKLDARLKAR
jgi:hypothetical protein